MVITMKKLNDFFEKHFIPFAVKLNNIKGLLQLEMHLYKFFL
jgi:PTS system cellobiose-specific IIC component